MSNTLQMLALFFPNGAWQLIESCFPLRSYPLYVLTALQQEGYLKQNRWQSSCSQINNQAPGVVLICPPAQLPDTPSIHVPCWTPTPKPNTYVCPSLALGFLSLLLLRLSATLACIISTPSPLGVLSLWLPVRRLDLQFNLFYRMPSMGLRGSITQITKAWVFAVACQGLNPQCYHVMTP